MFESGQGDGVTGCGWDAVGGCFGGQCDAGINDADADADDVDDVADDGDV